MKIIYMCMLGVALSSLSARAFANANEWMDTEVNVRDTDANIVGHVTDKDTGEHLPYVSVLLKGTTLGSVRPPITRDIIS